MKMSAIVVFERIGNKDDNIFNFLNGSFSVMDGPMDMIFAIFSEAIERLLKSIILKFLSKYS